MQDLSAAAQAAYETLLAAGVRSFPVDPGELTAHLPHVRLMSYRQAAAALQITESELRWDAPSQDAFTLCEQREGSRRFLILFEEGMPLPRRRFTLAHELGHVLLGLHPEDPRAEMLMNCFAAHLLCPRPLIRLMARCVCPLPQDWLCRMTGLSPGAIKMILSSPGPRVDEAIEKRLAQQLNQPLKMPEGCRPAPVMDPSPYLATPWTDGA